jgi:negative regulator of sigma E activity
MNTEYEEWQAELRQGPVHRDIHDWVAMGFQAAAVVAFVAMVVVAVIVGGRWV